MKTLINQIKKLKKGRLNRDIKEKIKEFKDIGNSSDAKIFKELCFCLLTANCSAESCIKVQKKINNSFLRYNKSKLISELKNLGYRFPNKRAEYIIKARKHKNKIRKAMQSASSCFDLREWLAKNIKGLGYKEASHFMRNIGYEDCAIIDFHIIDILSKNKFINKPKTVTKKTYLKIENDLKRLANKLNLTLSELDLYLWFLETGKILK